MLTVSTIEIDMPMAVDVSVSEDTLSVDLRDGRSISVPLAWYPRLANGSAKERDNWSLIGQGAGIHWEELDEDISLIGLLEGRPSGESQGSFQHWLAGRV
ncbi:MAG: DUF2442 domain-containing protein [Pseudomonadota bacterium]|nr:DUF2442 domain-containing protein [Pseudomonadota bacterium]